MRSVILVLVLAGCGSELSEVPQPGFEDMSIFRDTKRQTMQTQASSTTMPEVKTFDELLSALTNLPDPDLACRGKSIVIVGDIVFDDPVTLTAAHSGLTVYGVGRPRLIGSTLFEVDGEDGAGGAADVKDVSLSDFSASGTVVSVLRGDVTDLSISDIGSISNDSRGSISATSPDGGEAIRGSIRNCILSQVSGEFSNFAITSNVITTIALTGSPAAVMVSANSLSALTGTSIQDGVISGNSFEDGGSGIVTGGDGIAITGNAMNGQQIDVGGSTNHTIVGNADCGTITATDPSVVVASNS